MKLQLLPCYCATLRQAARAISTVYEDVFAGTGLFATQFSLLQLLSLSDDLSTTEVAESLGIDQTTATRNLAIMKKQGYIELAPHADRRRRIWTLTVYGKATVARLRPVWKGAQKLIENKLGRTKAKSLKFVSYESAARLTADG